LTPTNGRPRLLVADDHAPTRDDVRHALERDGEFDVCAEAADASEAVQAAVRERPDICLLDVRMPGSGVGAAWEIKARLPDTKVVMLTVSEADSDLFAALRAGADGYLLKTMNLERLGSALSGVLNGEASIHRTLVARILERLQVHEPRRRQLVPSGELASRLTSREWEVLELLAQGRSTSDIARELVLSKSAVRVHIAALVKKLGVEDRAAAAALFRSRSET
jgi:two-component system nitrate/nitrite response regulator NarL